MASHAGVVKVGARPALIGIPHHDARTATFRYHPAARTEDRMSLVLSSHRASSDQRSHRWKVLGVGVAANASFSAAFSGIPTTAVFMRSDYHLLSLWSWPVVWFAASAVALMAVPIFPHPERVAATRG
ncbi:hypothetical protein SAMN05444161_1792 [Rhizobiales bacterium GAS191]|nr:hypothetical protein SAMN05519103_00902 [Rhizobiales bacterium GAS113]SEC76533.1 hypothetical protein SAMN05444161_1792 [Rhizobiales bacterium GAS191]